MKELTGHGSIQMTLDIYGHLLTTESRNILNRFDTPNRAPYDPSKNKKVVTR